MFPANSLPCDGNEYLSQTVVTFNGPLTAYLTANGDWTSATIGAVDHVNVRIYRDYSNGGYTNVSYSFTDPHAQLGSGDWGFFHRELTDRVNDTNSHSWVVGIKCIPLAGHSANINVEAAYNWMAWSG